MPPEGSFAASQPELRTRLYTARTPQLATRSRMQPDSRKTLQELCIILRDRSRRVGHSRVFEQFPPHLHCESPTANANLSSRKPHAPTAPSASTLELAQSYALLTPHTAPIALPPSAPKDRPPLPSFPPSSQKQQSERDSVHQPKSDDHPAFALSNHQRARRARTYAA